MPPVVQTGSLSGVEIVRESTRRYIATAALTGFLVLLLAILVVGWVRGTPDDTVKLLTTVASILSGVVGAIVGFYFQSQKRSESE